jgi:hypothetical protein
MWDFVGYFISIFDVEGIYVSRLPLETRMASFLLCKFDRPARNGHDQMSRDALLVVPVNGQIIGQDVCSLVLLPPSMSLLIFPSAHVHVRIQLLRFFILELKCVAQP